MKKYKQITKRGLISYIVTSLIFIIVYWISFYELYALCRFGRVNNNVKVLELCMMFLFVLLIILIVKNIKRSQVLLEQDIDKGEFYSSCKTKWTCIIIISIVLITGFYGVKIYHSGIKYNGKLSWFLQDLKNKKTVKLEHDDIYKDGIEGIFKDINKKVNMPGKLYIANNFSLKFDYSGKITAFDAYLYGKNDSGKLQSYLISYDRNKSENITIYLNGYVNASYSKDKLLEPLIKTMKVIPLKKAVSKWPEKQYEILYYGKRSFGYNTQGIVYINSNGKMNSNVNAFSEIVGYFVSVFVPGKENVYTPVRYNLTDDLYSIKAAESSKENKKDKLFDETYNSANQFYLSKKVGYRLEITAAALGNRSYSLNKTTDGGATWKTINEDPFSGMVGTAAGITFLNDKLGFLCLSYNGGRDGQLYRTADGGASYKKVDFPEVKVPLSGKGTYNPFDLPGMPYNKSRSLNILVGQGSDGDYNGGCKALYESKDDGVTWSYVKEVPKN